MKPIILQNWQVDNSENLKLFAQLVEDMLFDYNLSSYKVKLLNTHGLIDEFLLFYPLVNKNVIHPQALPPIIDELILSLSKDEAAKQIFGDMFSTYRDDIKKNQQELAELNTLLGIMSAKLTRSYYDKLAQIVVLLILSNKNAKEILRSTTQSLLSELIYRGYSKSYIYNSINHLFFNEYAKIFSLDKIHDFFDFFDNKQKKYSVLFRLKRDLALNQALEISKFKIHEVVPAQYTRIGQTVLDLFVDLRFMYIEVVDIEALDQYSAKDKAAESIGLFEAFIFNDYHRYPIQIHKIALVWNEEDDWVYLIKKETAGILKQADKDKAKISDNIIRIVDVWDHLGQDELVAALVAHGDALKTDNVAHQFITLWSALESLIHATDEKTNIENVCDLLKPFFVLGYFERYTRHLHNFLNTKSRDIYSSVLAQISGGENDFQKTVLLLSMKKANEPIRDKLYPQIIAANPLLANKMFHLVSVLHDTDSLLVQLNKHVDYVMWQINRIYRARNMLVHGNNHLPYLNILIENLHEYFDRIIDVIITTSLVNPSIKNLNEIFYEVNLEANHYLKTLSDNKKQEIDSNNFQQFVLNKF